MFELNNLSQLIKKRKRVGRGGGRGGMSGRGHDGQKARSGGTVRIGFEGGQMPLYRRLPKRGFNNEQFRTMTIIVGLDRIDTAFDEGAIVTQESLIEKKIIKPQKGIKQIAVKILGNGPLTKKLIIEAHAFSGSAQKMITELGGEARLI